MRAATSTAHNEPVSGGQNELINPPETARVMRHSIITRATAFAISYAGNVSRTFSSESKSLYGIHWQSKISIIAD